MKAADYCVFQPP